MLLLRSFRNPAWPPDLLQATVILRYLIFCWLWLFLSIMINSPLNSLFFVEICRLPCSFPTVIQILAARIYKFTKHQTSTRKKSSRTYKGSRIRFLPNGPRPKRQPPGGGWGWGGWNPTEGLCGKLRIFGPFPGSENSEWFATERERRIPGWTKGFSG